VIRSIPILQLVQAVNLFILILIGKYWAFVYLPLNVILLLILFGTGIEYLFIYLRDRDFPYFSFSALSTVMGVSLMMVALKWWIYPVVIFLALLQKHLLRVEGRHFFNPSNFALIMALLFFHTDAGIVFGQLGNAFWFAIVVVFVGAVILYMANRWVISIAFCISYLLLQYLMIVGYDPVMTFEDIYWRFASVSFIVFVFYMLTDPRTTPEKRVYQFLFGLSVALVATVLDRVYGYRLQHPFLALFLLSGSQIIWMKKIDYRLKAVSLFVLIVAIISIQNHPPFYFAMDG